MSQKSELVAGRELDARVHAAIWNREVVMMQGQAYSRSRSGSWETLAIIPEYSTSIAAAWEVVERLRESGLRFAIHDRAVGPWFCSVVAANGVGNPVVFAKAETAPHAICLAAIQAVSRATKTP